MLHQVRSFYAGYANSLRNDGLFLFISLVLASVVIDLRFLFIAASFFSFANKKYIASIISFLGVFSLLGPLFFINVNGMQYYLCQSLFLKISLYIALNVFIFLFFENKKIIYGIGVVLITFCSVFPSVYHELVFHNVPLWDQSRHYFNVFRTIDYINKYGIFSSLLFYDFYTPLQYVVSAVFAPLSSVHYEGVLILSVVIWNCIGLYFSSRFFSEVLKVERSLSLLYSFVFISFSSLNSLKIEYMLDAQQVSILFAVFLYVFKFSQNNECRYFIKSLMWLVIGFWVKESFFAYGLAALAAYFFILFFYDKNYSASFGIVGIGGFFLFFASIWFVFRGGFYFWDLSSSDLNGIAEGDPPVYSVQSFIWYATRIPSEYIGIPVFLTLLSVGLYRRKEFNKNDFVFIIFVCFIYLFFTMKLNKDLRYALPLVFIGLPFLGKIGRSLNNSDTFIIILCLSVFSLCSNISQISNSTNHGAIDGQNAMFTAAIIEKYYTENNIETCYALDNPSNINFHRWGVESSRREVGLISNLKVSGSNCNKNYMLPVFSLNGNVLFAKMKLDIHVYKDKLVNNYYLFKTNNNQTTLDYFYGDGVGDYKILNTSKDKLVVNVCRSYPSLPLSLYYAINPTADPCGLLVQAVGYIQ